MIKDLLIPQPKGPARWWHRLANVVVYGTTLLVLGFLLFLFFIGVVSLWIVILVVIGWFVFWESIIYRAFLYIIYGRDS